jgi:hypothetical protein
MGNGEKALKPKFCSHDVRLYGLYKFTIQIQIYLVYLTGFLEQLSIQVLIPVNE